MTTYPVAVSTGAVPSTVPSGPGRRVRIRRCLDSLPDWSRLAGATSATMASACTRATVPRRDAAVVCDGVAGLWPATLTKRPHGLRAWTAAIFRARRTLRHTEALIAPCLGAGWSGGGSWLRPGVTGQAAPRIESRDNGNGIHDHDRERHPRHGCGLPVRYGTNALAHYADRCHTTFSRRRVVGPGGTAVASRWVAAVQSAAPRARPSQRSSQSGSGEGVIANPRGDEVAQTPSRAPRRCSHRQQVRWAPTSRPRPGGGDPKSGATSTHPGEKLSSRGSRRARGKLPHRPAPLRGAAGRPGAGQLAPPLSAARPAVDHSGGAVPPGRPLNPCPAAVAPGWWCATVAPTTRRHTTPNHTYRPDPGRGGAL